MFGMPPEVSRKDLKAVVIDLTATDLAVLTLLQNKGLIDEQDLAGFAVLKTQCLQAIDQEAEELEAKAKKEWREENPEEAKLADVFGKLLGEAE